MPQTWRENARTYNGVSHSSYRDSVWPLQHHPPGDICSKYWAGESHPESGTHAMIASAILFQFLIVRELTNPLLQLSKLSDSAGPKAIETPKNICLDLISSYRAIQDDPEDPFQVDSNKGYGESCWSFRADVKRKFGWICEVRPGTNPTVASGNYLRLSKNLRIGGDRKVIISRLVSYDDRMAIGQIWFSASAESNENIFEGDPVWNISSWHEEKTSIPQPYAIQLEELQFKDSSQLQWPLAEADGFVEVTFNLKILLGSSRSRSKVDKFKLLGIASC